MFSARWWLIGKVSKGSKPEIQTDPLTLNPDLYAVHPAAVVVKPKADTGDTIEALEIK